MASHHKAFILGQVHQERWLWAWVGADSSPLDRLARCTCRTSGIASWRANERAVLRPSGRLQRTSGLRVGGRRRIGGAGHVLARWRAEVACDALDLDGLFIRA